MFFSEPLNVPMAVRVGEQMRMLIVMDFPYPDGLCHEFLFSGKSVNEGRMMSSFLLTKCLPYIS